MESDKAMPKKSRRLTVPSGKTQRFLWAKWGTVTWFLLLSLLGLSCRDGIAEMSPNEWGDFLAGTFTPVAFLWLIVGYYQQGEELRLQRKELALQRAEFELQREELHALVGETARQAGAEERREAREHERQRVALEPRLIFGQIRDLNVRGSQGPVAQALSFHNAGGPARCLEVRSEIEGLTLKCPHTYLEQGQGSEVRISYDRGHELPTVFLVDYQTKTGERRRKRYRFTGSAVDVVG